jgi:ubiquinone/menaquinone biosynthesis C-methylase UbiE
MTEKTTDETYTLGYGEGAMDWMTSRTAEGHGAFLIPYLQPGMSLLDCGCGPGTLTRGFAERVAPGTVIGIDREASQFAAMSEAARRDDIGNLTFQTGDIYALPFADGTFDVVFGSAVLGSVAGPEKVVAEMTRVLKPGGWIGLKEFDHGGDIVWPMDSILDRSIALYHRLRAHNGHEPQAGRKLKNYMQNAGCITEHCHARYYQTNGAEQLLAHIERNNRLVSEMLGVQYIALGWCSQAELDEDEQVWIEFAKNPAAIYLATWFEAVGKKMESGRR